MKEEIIADSLSERIISAVDGKVSFHFILFDIFKRITLQQTLFFKGSFVCKKTVLFKILNYLEA